MKKAPINYLKQYTCLQFSNFMQGGYTPQVVTTITFKGKCNTIPQELPHQLIDRIGGHQQMIICKWNFALDDFVILDLFEYFRQGCARLEMNYRPQFLQVVQGFLYIVGGNQIHVLELGSLKHLVSYSLGNDTIHAIDSAFPQELTGEFGVWVYSSNEKKGYRKRFFSPKTRSEDRWWSDLGNSLFSKKAPRSLQGSVLKVLIPNVLGILLMPNQEEVVIFDLDKMEIIESCTVKLTGWNLQNLSKVKAKIHKNKQNQGYDDSLLISIGEMGREMIQIFILEIKYEGSIIRNYIEMMQQKQQMSQGVMPSISSFTNSQIVDWSNCLFRTFISYSTSGSLIDYLLTQTGIIFYSQTASRIPVSGFVNYSSLLTLHPIICLEHNICSMHLKDVETYNKIKQLKKQAANNQYGSQSQEIFHLQKQLMNSILSPNRYSIPFLYSAIGQSPLNKIHPRIFSPHQLLSYWIKDNRIRNIHLFNGDVIIVRQNSVTSFLPIGEEQFTLEFQNGEKMLQYLMDTSDNEGKESLASYELSLGQTHYSNYLPIQYNDQIESIWQQIGKDKDAFAFNYEIEGQENIEDQLYDNHFQLENQGSAKTNLQHEKLSSQTYNKYSSILLEAIKLNGQSMNLNNNSVHVPQSSLITRKCLAISKQLISNRVKDIIHFYSHILKFLFSKVNKIPSFMFPNENPVIHKIMVRYLSSLDKLMMESLNQANVHETNLLQNYILIEIAKLEQKILHDDEVSKQTQDIIIDVEQESWKIIAGIFEDIVLENPKEKPAINGFVKFLINYVVSQYQYIEQILFQIFYPYPSNQSQISIHQNHSSNLSSAKIFTNTSSIEECHFPLTPTILNIYCMLPVSDLVRQRLICSYVLGKFGSIKQPQLVNLQIMSLVGLDGISKNSIKQGIRSIHAQVFQGKLERDIQPNTLKSNSLSKSFVPNSIRNSFENNQIDNTRGIICLSKLLEPKALQDHLLSLNDQDLQLIFKTSMQHSLQRICSNNIQKVYDSEELMMGEVFYYRTYAIKLREFIKQIEQNNSKGIEEEQPSSMQKKGKAYSYIRKCIKSFENIRALYSNISKGAKIVASSLPDSKDPLSHLYPAQTFTDEQLIKKLCVNAIGYDDISDLQLYPKNNKSQQIHSFILPTTDFLNLLQNIIKDENTRVQCIASLLSISFYYIEKILDDPYHYIQAFRQLASFFSSRQLSNLILNNATLREKYYQLCNFPQSEEFNQIKSFFGYSAVTSLSPIGHQSHSLNSSNFMTENNGSQIYASARRSQSNKKNTHGARTEENLMYSRLDFRNAFLEAQGS